MKINEVDPRNYDSDIDYYDALRRSGRKPQHDPDDYEQPEPYDAEDAISQQRQAAAAKARKERETTWDNKEEGSAPNGQKYNSVYTIAAPSKASADSEAYSFKDYHWGAKKVVDQAYRDLGDGRVELKLYVVDNHKYGLWRPWKDSPVYKEGVAEGTEQQYAVTIDAIDHGVLAPVTVVASSPEEAKQKAIAGVKASMIKRGYELMVRSVSAKPTVGVAEGDVTHTSTGLVHRAKDKYGAGKDEEHRTSGRDGFPDPGKYARDINSLNMKLVKDLDDGYDIHWKKRGREIDVDEGMFGIDSRTKGAIQNVVSQLSDIPGMWDHQGQTFTPQGLEQLHALLKNNEQHIDYAVNLTADDFDESITEDDNRTERLRAIVQRAIATSDRSEWDELTPRDKSSGLYAAGLVSVSDLYSYTTNSSLSDELLHQKILQRQQQQYDVEIGPEKRAELKAKADELAEMRRQQLRQENLEDKRIAYERYKDEQERKDAMKKIEMEYKHDLDMINTEHRNNMEAIRTGNSHEINKIVLDHAESARDREHELNMLRQQQEHENQDRPQREKPDAAARPEPEPEEVNEPEDEEDGEPYRPQAPAGPALTAPTQPTKPDRFNNDDAIDVDFREVPDDEEEAPTPGKPPQLGAPKKESAKNPYAIGMAQAMKSKGDRPPLDKATIRKAHEIAKRIMKQD